MKKIITLLLLLALVYSCKNTRYEEKGFSVNSDSPEEQTDHSDGIMKDSISFATAPKQVLNTWYAEHRLIPVFKVNYNKKNEQYYVGSLHFHYLHSDYYYEEEEKPEKSENNWNGHLMPGFEAVYGYNFVNVSHYTITEKKQHTFFEKPVLIKTLYYPAFSKDTLNYKPINRNYYMVSAYDEDTNKDGKISPKDLRRLYYFDINAENARLLIDKEYSVFASDYDSANDYMYIYATLDKNKNGTADETEPIHIFWIDLANPENTGRGY